MNYCRDLPIGDDRGSRYAASTRQEDDGRRRGRYSRMLVLTTILTEAAWSGHVSIPLEFL